MVRLLDGNRVGETLFGFDVVARVHVEAAPVELVGGVIRVSHDQLQQGDNIKHHRVRFSGRLYGDRFVLKLHIFEKALEKKTLLKTFTYTRETTESDVIPMPGLMWRGKFNPMSA